MKIEDQIVDTLLQSDFGALPEEAVTGTKKSIIDTLGVIIAGRRAEGCREVVELVRQWGGKKEATILSYGFKVPFPQASLANAVMARALDLDEVHDMGTVHTSASVIPGALAAAETMGKVTGKEFIVAVALGIDLIARMSLAPQSGACISGMAGSYQAGTFGTAAAVGKLFKLNRKQMANALGIAYSQAAGNSQCYVDGCHMIRVQQGLSASAGALSAILASRGITGAQEFFEGKFGYFNTYHGGRYDREVLLRNYGMEFVGCQVSQKPLYGCCKFTHAFIDAAIILARQHGIKPEQIEEVEAQVSSPEAYNFVCDPIEVKRTPRTIMDAQFSLPYTIALALVKGRVSMDDFTPRAIREEETLKLAQKVKIAFLPGAERILPAPGIVRLRTNDGRQYETRVDFVKGHPRNPNSLEDCLGKMKSCLQYGKFKIKKNDWISLADILLNLEEAADIRPVIAILSS